jgi:hypothetical protein
VGVPLRGVESFPGQELKGRVEVLDLVGKVLDDVLLPSDLGELVDDLHKRVHVAVALHIIALPFHQKEQVLLDCVHDRLHQKFQQCVEQSRLFLVFLKDEADAVPNFVEWKFVEGLLLDSGHGFTVFMQEIETDILRIFREGLLLLHEEVGVLCHALVDVFLVPLGLRGTNSTVSPQVGVLKMLVGFLEVEELALDVERSHGDI